MPKRTPTPFLLFPALLLAVPVRATEPAPDVKGLEFFEKKVRPVLVEHCHKCHSTAAGKAKGGLTLDSRAGLLKGGDNGPAVVPGEPDRSRLVRAISYADIDLQMPPRGKLPPAVLADLTEWVRRGAPWPAEGGTGAFVEEFDLQKRKESHWAWRPVRAPALPDVKDAAWPLDPADRFILAKLEAKGLSPAGSADRRTLLRRLSFDLTGLPPTPEEVADFVADTSPDAYARVVDRLLESRHFGERWGRHWLDLVRYAETHGHEFDYPIPGAHHYRDYVIRAFNADVPYDQFVREHIAGDLLEDPRLHPTEGFNESILGTGFWFLGEAVHSPVDIRQDQADRFDNRIDVFGKAFLGLTVACARCHDHKFDALSARDYYALFAVLESSGYRLARFDTMEHNRAVAEDLGELRGRARANLGRALADELKPTAGDLAEYLLAAAGAAGKEKLDPDSLSRWEAHLEKARKDSADPFHAWAVAGDRKARDPKHLAALLRPVAEGMKKRRAEAALEGVDVVIDYATAGPAEWMPDGFAYGPGPVRRGELLLGDDPDRPLAGLNTRGAAVRDPAWERLKLAPGAEKDSGALGGIDRAGRTLRTPTFTVTTGKVFYLVRGKGAAYAAVGHHALIGGPLHGNLILPFDAGKDYRWIAHDLGRYQGLPAHVEFSGGADFAVAMVVQADRPPPVPDPPDEGLLRLLSGASSRKGLARGYQHLVLEALDRLASGDGSAHAGMLSWLAGHRELFVGDVAASDKRLREAVGDYFGERDRLVSRIREESRLAVAMMDGSGVDGRVFVRGSHKSLGERVPRRFLEALAGPGPISSGPGSGRLALARRMTDPEVNPFLARVMVNRIWHHLFGRGIVPSVDDFGHLGERPTHPELLDHLAARFVKEGWSVKKMVRALVLSRTYRMAAQADDRAERADPKNDLLHRMRIRRLEGEAIRDALLAVSGRLDPRMYGPSVPVYLTPFQDGRGRPDSGPLNGEGRRSVYLAVRRNFLSPMLLAFDTPAPFSTMGRRTVSNVPAQALILMNDPFVHQQAQEWGKRVHARGGSVQDRVHEMYLRAFARPPTEEEARACAGFVGGRADDPSAWADLAHVLFNVKEFIFVN